MRPTTKLNNKKVTTSHHCSSSKPLMMRIRLQSSVACAPFQAAHPTAMGPTKGRSAPCQPPTRAQAPNKPVTRQSIQPASRSTTTSTTRAPQHSRVRGSCACSSAVASVARPPSQGQTAAPHRQAGQRVRRHRARGSRRGRCRSAQTSCRSARRAHRRAVAFGRTAGISPKRHAHRRRRGSSSHGHSSRHCRVVRMRSLARSGAHVWVCRTCIERVPVHAPDVDGTRWQVRTSQTLIH